MKHIFSDKIDEIDNDVEGYHYCRSNCTGACDSVSSCVRGCGNNCFGTCSGSCTSLNLF